ncbi:MAG: hypothetical protein NT051_05385, partial [Candidatus Micrarchaeota archaeon]|nr:hypothetical protein [Candidatus Micrarchaeota archaeon]
WCPGYEPCTYSNYSAPAVFACSAIGEACTSAADCCNSKPCNPGGVCVTALTPPPLAPQPSPHIQSLLTPFYANGTAECTNCNSILPRAGAFLQYHWVYGGQSTQWGNSPPPPLDCGAYGCQAGSTVTFEMRACAIADPSVCSIFSHSNPLPVAYPPLPPV